jgi:DNA repair photolyase
MAKNMYSFVDKRWNPVRGKCVFDCSYCYTKQWGRSYPLHLDRRVLKKDLGNGKIIFICSGCDLFAPDVPYEWQNLIVEQTQKYTENQYLWHTKNPYYLVNRIRPAANYIACVTIETNKYLPSTISSAPMPWERIKYLHQWEGKRMITIEPIINFDLEPFVEMIKDILPIQVNIGADSRKCNLPEPSREKIIELISELENFTTVHKKSNLGRLLHSETLNKYPMRAK